jgi:hypothetical protein
MTIEEHRARHVMLHKMLDELAADYLSQKGAEGKPQLLAETTLMELITWSYEQTLAPTPTDPSAAGDEWHDE